MSHSDAKLSAVGGHSGGEALLVATDLDQGRTGALTQQGAWVTVTLGVGDELHQPVQLLREPVPVLRGVAVLCVVERHRHLSQAPLLILHLGLSAAGSILEDCN